MKQSKNNKIFYTASALMNFLGCSHSTYLDVKRFKKNLKINQENASSELFKKKGVEHESAYLQRLEVEGRKIIKIPKDLPLEIRSQLTFDALRSGTDVIYQAALVYQPWRGDADFLIKDDNPSELGDFSYEVLDTKLAKTVDPKYIIQLCFYSEILSKLQGVKPQEMHLVLGDDSRHSFKFSDFYYYFAHAKQSFESFLGNFPNDSYPNPCSHCQNCKWSEHCSEQWQNDNHLSLIANIKRSQMDKLREADVRNVKALAELSEDNKIPNLDENVFFRLRSQALLQTHKAETGEDCYKILPQEPGKGFARLPLSDEGDLFFDMEGDPLYPNGLEYLFGVYFLKEDDETFLPFWAHSHAEEKKIFKRFMAFVEEHLSRHPNARIYHYNHYEETALKRLACRYAVCEEQLDNLLRQKKFIDLYKVVREGIRTSEPGYSIKNLETFYMDKRSNEVATASDSIVVYNKWRETGDDRLLMNISDYNREDCVSNFLLRNWLLKLKPSVIPFFKCAKENVKEERVIRKPWEVEYEMTRSRLEENTTQGTEKLYKRLTYLLEFHKREEKTQWWSLFERREKFEDELLQDKECIAGMTLIKSSANGHRLFHTYKFPEQEYKLKDGSRITNATTTNEIGNIFKIQEDTKTVQIATSSKNRNLPEKLSIGPTGPINTNKLRGAIYRVANELLDGTGNHQCICDLLNKNIPRINGKKEQEPIITSSDLQHDALVAILNLNNSYLFIQGPPGTGKTHISSRIIVELMRQGKKVGVASNSHKAIDNLLNKIEEVATKEDFNFKGMKKDGSSNEPSYNGRFIQGVNNYDKIQLSSNLIAGTAWLFAQERLIDQLDYLFIDEAGQVSLANVVAMSTSTKNLILVGDQMQLGQPIQGTHPEEAGLSILEFLLGHQETISPERGIFLDKTYRLHPNICRFISDTFYEERLTTHESTSRREIIMKNYSNGIAFIAVNHYGCSQKSVEEGHIIRDKYEELLKQKFKDKDGVIRTVSKSDILVVTPFNVQVNYLQSILPKGARIGTVDKFQGQEAPMVLISMVTSGEEDLSLNIEFLYSKNRLNVALSRAQCLAIIVANPQLFTIPCKTVEQMHLVNIFCRIEDCSLKQ